MGNELEIARFRKLLTALAEERDLEPMEPSGPFMPLRAGLQNQLYQISLARHAAPLPWYSRLVNWLRQPFARKVWVPFLLMPTTAAVFTVYLTLDRLPLVRYVSAPVAESKLRAGTTRMPRDPDGRILLGGAESEVKERPELRVKHDDMLTLFLPPTPGEKGPLAVRAFLRRDGVLRPWDVSPESRPDGSFLFLGPVRALPDLGVEQELLFVCGRPQELPSLEEFRAGKPPSRWHLQSLRLVVED